MKLSWRVILLWTLPLLVIGFFLWQGAFSSSPADMGAQQPLSTRMTYGPLSRLSRRRSSNLG